jgi:hypothetical protein
VIPFLAEVAYWGALAIAGLVLYGCAFHGAHRTRDGMRTSVEWFVAAMAVMVIANIWR